MSESIRERDLGFVTPAPTDEVRLVRGGKSVRASAVKLPVPEDAQRQIDELVAGQQTDAIYARTKEDLDAVTGEYVGQGGFVVNDPDSGQYRWDGEEWEFLRPDILTSKADRQQLIATTDQTRAPFDGMVAVEASDVAPVGYVGADGSIPLGIRLSDGALIARFRSDDPDINLISKRQVQAALPESIYVYEGPGPIIPFVINEQYQVIDGINSETGERIGVNAGAGGAYPPLQLHDLPPEVVPDVADWNHVIVYGQSLSIGATALPPIHTASRFNHLTFGAGPRATKAGSTGANPGTDTVVPLIENTLSGDGGSNRGETPCSGLANAFTTYAAEDAGMLPSEAVLFCSAPGHGEYSLAELDMDSPWSQVLRDHVTEAKARATDAGKTYAVTAMVWMQGESDTTTPYQTYYDGMVAFYDDFVSFVKGVTGQTFDPVFVMYQTPNNGASGQGGQISEAQLNLCLNHPGFVYGGPLYHLDSTDGTHITNVSSVRAGWQFGRAIKQYLVDKKVPAFIKPGPAVREGNTIRWRFEVPQPPLVLDTVNLPPTQDFGFRVNDSGGEALEITGIEVRQGDTVVLTLADASDATVIRYGLDYLGTGTNWNNEETGNLRDSTPGSISILGSTYYRWHVAPSCRASIIDLGSPA